MTDEEIAALKAEALAARAEADNAKARIKDLNDEAKGHRLNADKHKAEAAAAEKARDEAAADAARVKTEAEAAAAAKVTAAEAKAAEAAKAAQERAVNADLKIAAKDAGAHDAGDALALLDRGKITLDAKGEISNAAALIAELKKAKPHLFGAASTSSTAATPPPAGTSTREEVTTAKPADYRAKRTAFLAELARPPSRKTTAA